jgi:hypothetical protein
VTHACDACKHIQRLVVCCRPGGAMYKGQAGPWQMLQLMLHCMYLYALCMCRLRL